MSAEQLSFDPESLDRASRDAYSQLAEDYYNSYHVTTRNFDLLIDTYLHIAFRHLPTDRRWLDVGCGKTKLAGVLEPTKVVLLDSTIDMLRHSLREFPSFSSAAVLGSAFALPFRSASFSGVFASLGDPFTHPEYFTEARRVLVRGGTLLHLVPSQQWGTALRQEQGVPLHCSHFFRGKSKCFAPSLLLSHTQLTTMLTTSGFCDTVVLDLYLPETLPPSAISPDIHLSAKAQGLTSYEIPIITAVQGIVP